MQDHDRVAALAGDAVLARLIGQIAGEPVATVGPHEQHVHHRTGVLGQVVELHLVDLIQAPAQIRVGGSGDEDRDPEEDAGTDEKPVRPPSAGRPVVAPTGCRAGSGRHGR